MSDLQAKVRASLDLHSDQAQDRILDAVTEELQRADPTARLERTGYFNHSYLPDLVASWGSKSRVDTRPFYLRLQFDRRQIGEDVGRLGNDAPAFIGLLPSEMEESNEQVSINNSPGTLVAEAGALEEIASAPTGDAFAAMVPPAVVRAGRGYLDTEGAASLAEAAETGFDAAAAGDSESTRVSLQTLRRHLTDVQAVELERTLSVVWLGSGGDRDEFPAAHDFDSSPLPGTLGATLAMLFEQPLIGRFDFWERVASWISEDDLLSFNELAPSPNLQQLMQFASARLSFVSVAVTRAGLDDRLGDWSVTNGGLLFSAGDVALHFVRDGRSHSHWPEQVEPPRWDAIKSRLRGMTVERAQFESQTVSVRVDATERSATPADQSAVMQSIQEMSGLGRVREILVRSSRGPSVRCRMAAQVATVDRSKRIPAAELGWIALSVLVDSEDGPSETVLESLFGASDARLVELT